MYWLDTTLLALVGLGAGLGMWSGLFWQIARLGSLVVAIYVTILSNDAVTQLLKAGPLVDAHAGVVQAIAYVVVFLAAYLALYLLMRLIHRSIRAADLVLFDRFLGGLLGAGKMTLILAAACLAAASYQHPVPQEWMTKSTLAPAFAQGMQAVLVVIPEEYKENLRGTLESLRELMARHVHEGALSEPRADSKKDAPLP